MFGVVAGTPCARRMIRDTQHFVPSIEVCGGAT
jgi:hypothetical protein